MDLPGSMYLNEFSADTGAGIVNLFPDHFKFVYSCNTKSLPISDFSSTISTDKGFSSFQFSFDKVLGGLLSLKDCISVGPDEIPVDFKKVYQFP